MNNLNMNALNRKQANEIYNDFLEEIVNRKGKGYKSRLLFYRFIKTYSDGQPFLNEETEYEIIGKLYRRDWTSEKVFNSFTEEEKKIVLVICDMFGCNNY